MEGKVETDSSLFNDIAFPGNFSASWHVVQGDGISAEFFMRKSLLNSFVDYTCCTASFPMIHIHN